ncbi:nucleotidyltransferase domain-containing protein [Herbivorax sp. ANBcel31]|uniref:nucleotidyltransferase domain-containing protein n=1 Tax=Herbivorax sp. ANBcel31 TaxID=3069754 RepID=UPI0027B3A3BC|nr:nucleotidyltransferase domain-containing protein [Herbivorax sp. ANBcel31]MDQ2086782.1 nucleotidyltransferase domain-containing protein [Herbivorax sp. ANBcel31]
MSRINFANDRIINRVTSLLEKFSESMSVEVMSIVLYGSRARGDNTSQSDYEFLILIGDGTPLEKFISFGENLKLTLLKEKYINVKPLFYTAEIFEEILYKDKMVGTFLYMICRENVILYDKYGTFMSIRDRLFRNNRKREELFLAQCVEFAKLFGSEKWERKWERILLQFKYHSRRRRIY